MFGKLFGQKSSTRQNEPGEGVVSVAKLSATGGFEDVLEKASSHGWQKTQHLLEDWDFYVTVAIVYNVMVCVSSGQKSDAQKSKLFSKIGSDLKSYQVDAIDAYEDLKKFYSNQAERFVNEESTVEGVANLLTGYWVISNICGRKLEDAEMRDASLVGSFITAHGRLLYRDLC